MICIVLLFFLAILVYPRGYFLLDAPKHAISYQEPGKHYQGTGIYLINLDRCKARYAYVMPKIQALGLPIERISAIDGKALSPETITEKVDIPTFRAIFKRDPDPGTIGCYLSHVKAWESLLRSPFEFALICEDDIDFNPTELSQTIQELTQYRTYWDIANLECFHKRHPLCVTTMPHSNKSICVYLTIVSHTGAYLINRRAAAKLVEKALPMRTAVDHFFSQCWEFDGLIFTGIEPCHVFQNFGDSEIRKIRVTKKEKNLREYIIGKNYRIKLGIMRFFYNLKLFFKLRYFHKET